MIYTLLISAMVLGTADAQNAVAKKVLQERAHVADTVTAIFDENTKTAMEAMSPGKKLFGDDQMECVTPHMGETVYGYNCGLCQSADVAMSKSVLQGLRSHTEEEIDNIVTGSLTKILKDINDEESLQKYGHCSVSDKCLTYFKMTMCNSWMKPCDSCMTKSQYDAQRQCPTQLGSVLLMCCEGQLGQLFYAHNAQKPKPPHCYEDCQATAGTDNGVCGSSRLASSPSHMPEQRAGINVPSTALAVGAASLLLAGVVATLKLRNQAEPGAEPMLPAQAPVATPPVENQA